MKDTTKISKCLNSISSSFFFKKTTGPPSNFCAGKGRSFFANPENPSEYFFCHGNGVSSGCQSCGGSLVYFAECGQCLEQGSSKTYIKFIKVKISLCQF